MARICARRGTSKLAGTYIGASGSVGVGVGVGANLLFGGTGRSIALQPLSLEGSVGINLSCGVSGLTLAAAWRALAPISVDAMNKYRASFGALPADVLSSRGFTDLEQNTINSMDNDGAAAQFNNDVFGPDF